MKRLLIVVTLILGVASTWGYSSRSAQAFEQGSITATAEFTSGAPDAAVDVCFVITSDEDGVDQLARACAQADNYSVSFGPTDPDLQTGVVYYVWEEIDGKWSVSSDNPAQVVIPDSTGEAAVSFQNSRSAGAATLTIHKAVCPEDTGNLFNACHDDRVSGVHFSAAGQRMTTDKQGVATVQIAAGKVRVTEAELDFNRIATAGEAYVYCDFEPGPSNVLFDGRASHRSAVLSVPAGATVVCDWYDLVAAAPKPATLEIHKRVCPSGPPTVDIFTECHGNLPQQPVSFSIDGGASELVGNDGNVTFDGLDAGTHSVAETEGPPLEFVDLRVFCSVVGSGEESVELRTDGPNFDITLGEGQHVVCDVYNISEDLSGRTPTPKPTRTPAGPTATPTKTPPVQPTKTSTALLTATVTNTQVPPTVTSTPIAGMPVHIHGGTCAQLSTEPRYDLVDLTSPSGAFEGSEAAAQVAASYSLVDISLTKLLASDFSINVHSSHKQMRPFLACGEIGGATRSDGSIVVGLREQNGSGYTGIAYLSPDPKNADRTRISVFVSKGLAEEDPTLQPPAGDVVIIDSIVNNGPVSPEFQTGYEIMIDSGGNATVVITPPGASPALGDDRSVDQRTRRVTLTSNQVGALLSRLNKLGYFQLTQAEEIDPADIAVGGATSRLTVNLVDGTWDVDGNGLPEGELAILGLAQELVADAVGGVELPES